MGSRPRTLTSISDTECTSVESDRIVLVAPMIMLIPMLDQFDVYEVFDTPEMKAPRTVIATARGSSRLHSDCARLGGVLKELYFEDKTGREHGLYLEAMCYTPLE